MKRFLWPLAIFILLVGITPRFASSTSTGCSSRQDTHHEAQTLSSHTLPRISPGAKRLSGCCSTGRSNAGAGLPTSGEGT